MHNGFSAYKVLNISNVRNSDKNTIAFLKAILPRLVSHEYNVIFLGETHRDAVDVEVTKHLLLNLPVIKENATRVILERSLNYVVGNPADYREEKFNNDRRAKRSVKIADMILDAFNNNGKKLVYVACGSEHGKEVYKSLNKRVRGNFGFIFKPSRNDILENHSLS